MAISKSDIEKFLETARNKLNSFYEKLESHWPNMEQCEPDRELEEILSDLLKTYPHSPSLWVWAGRFGGLFQIFGFFTLFEPAEMYYLKALELDPLCHDAYEELAVLADIRENLSLAETCYRTALMIDPKMDLYRGLSGTLAQQNRWQESEECIDDGLKICRKWIKELKEAKISNRETYGEDDMA